MSLQFKFDVTNTIDMTRTKLSRVFANLKPCLNLE